MNRRDLRNTNNLVELIDGIIYVFHKPTIRDIPRIEEDIEILIEDYGKKFPEIKFIKELFSQFKREVLKHMQEEEEVFFPILREIEECCSNSKEYNKCDLKKFDTIIKKLERKHEEFDTYVFDLVDVFRDTNIHRESREIYERYNRIFSQLEESVMKHTEIENLRLHIIAREKYNILCNGK